MRAVRTARPSDYGWQTAALRSPQARIQTVATAMRTVPNDVIALHAGYPDPELLPGRLVRSALTRAVRGDTALSRPPVAGLPELQSWFAQELGTASPLGVAPPTPSDVIVLPGSQSGLSSIFRALVSAGQPLLMESPTYWGAITAAAQAGVRVVPVPTGPDGPDPGELARAFDETGARVLYAQPTYANPTGAQWSTERAEQVLAVVRDHGAFLVEDDWAHDFGISTTPRPVAAQDDAGHVVYLRSLTKSVSPALRIAAVIARGPARERILADRGAESMYVSGLLQAAALDVVTQPAWQTHLRSVREQLRARRDLLVDSLHEHAPTGAHRPSPHRRAEPVGTPARRDRPGPARPGLRARRGAHRPRNRVVPRRARRRRSCGSTTPARTRQPSPKAPASWGRHSTPTAVRSRHKTTRVPCGTNGLPAFAPTSAGPRTAANPDVRILGRATRWCR